MISEQEVERIWQEESLPENIRGHSRAVQKKALEIASRLAREGIVIDKDLIKIGSLLHDIGRSKDHSVKQGIVGYKILKDRALPEELCDIVKVHVGAGIAKEEAVELGLPAQDLVPESLEEKIVSYADNLIRGTVEVSYEETLQEWEQKFGENSSAVKYLILEHAELEDFITREEMLQMEQASEIPVSRLMELVGRGISNLIKNRFGLEGKKILVFSGSGNNGGDGLSTAHDLKELGADVEVFLFGEPDSAESKKMLEMVKSDEINVKIVESEGDVANVYGDIVIDALLGTGVSGNVREPIATGIRKINSLGAIKVSIDMPSGLNANTGEKANVVVKPDLVISLHKFKKGLVGKYRLGKVILLDIGIR